ADVLLSSMRDNGVYDLYVYLNCSDEHTLEIEFCAGEYMLSLPEPGDGNVIVYTVGDIDGDGIPDLNYGEISISEGGNADIVRLGRFQGGAFSFSDTLLSMRDDFQRPPAPVSLNFKRVSLDVNGDGLGDIFEQRYVQAVPGGAVNPETHRWL